jgi:hypothetical protein
MEMLSPSKCPLPNPYTVLCEFSTVGSNAAGPFLTASSLPPSPLPSLQLRTRNGFLLMQTLPLEIKRKSHGVGQVSRVDVPTRGSCASPETSWQCVMRRHVVLPHFRSLSSNPFTKDCQNILIVDLVNGLWRIWPFARQRFGKHLLKAGIVKPKLCYGINTRFPP